MREMPAMRGLASKKSPLNNYAQSWSAHWQFLTVSRYQRIQGGIKV